MGDMTRRSICTPPSFARTRASNPRCRISPVRPRTAPPRRAGAPGGGKAVASRESRSSTQSSRRACWETCAGLAPTATSCARGGM
eukprot:8803619-Alexandrium_andersonii.AAC.1